VTDLRLIAQERPSGPELDFLIRGLQADEAGRDGDPAPQPFAFFLADGDTPVGGLTGFGHAGGGFIDLFYVAPGRRGQGLGRRLIEAAAAHCRDRRMAFLTVNTMDAAARDYYLARGFVVEFVRPGYLNGRALTYLRRDL
jgi:GNAT superfamily N-acetyltransferase